MAVGFNYFKIRILSVGMNRTEENFPEPGYDLDFHTRFRYQQSVIPHAALNSASCRKTYSLNRLAQNNENDNK